MRIWVCAWQKMWLCLGEKCIKDMCPFYNLESAISEKLQKAFGFYARLATKDLATKIVIAHALD